MSAVALGILLAAAACTSTRPAPRTVRPTPEDVAPQIPASSGVTLIVTPTRLRAGLIQLRTSGRGRDGTWTATHAWMDRQVGGRWVAVWLLARGLSVSVDQYRGGGVLPNSDAVSVPGVLSFSMSPPPPPGHYRLRLRVRGSPPESEGGPPPTWATAMVEILPP